MSHAQEFVDGVLVAQWSGEWLTGGTRFDAIEAAQRSVAAAAPMPPPPPAPRPPLNVWNLTAGTIIPAGLSVATVLPDLDFETYSDAGYLWDDNTAKWGALPGASQGKKGLGIVGSQVYAEHPSTEVLSLYYDLKDGRGRRRWLPGEENPHDLFDHVRRGGILEAWNSSFEWRIWNFVCTRRYGWPSLQRASLRCAMAKARAFSLPGALGNAGSVLDLQYKKDPEGDRLLKKFSIPRNPTAKDKRKRIRPSEDADDGPRLYAYNERDIVTEAEASSRTPDLNADELQYWLLDQEINHRGVQMDRAGISNCCAIVNQALAKYNRELQALTGGTVQSASEIAKLTGWLGAQGVHMESLGAEVVEERLDLDRKSRKAALKAVFDGDAAALKTAKRFVLPNHARRALELRELIGSAAVKKVFTMANMLSMFGRLHDLFTYYGARTGRTTGNDAQPTNLPNSGPEVHCCANGPCGRHFRADTRACPWCQMPVAPGRKPVEWGARAVEDALLIIGSRALEVVEHYFGDAMAAVSGCLRGLFIAAPGKDLICSDYSSIEAVVLAMIAGEQWRIDVFRTHGKIYEMSAAKIAGIPFNDFMKHAGYTDEELAAPDWYLRKPATPGSHHPLRKKVGKVGELASGYQGGVGSWVAFGADEFMSEEEMATAVKAWRAASPMIVGFWGGQQRRTHAGWVDELHGVEGMFIAACLNPGVQYEFRGFKFLCRDDVLYLTLLSGRHMAYHRPRLEANTKGWGGAYQISYEGWNSNPKNGPTGWIRMRTWGGRLTENIVQATARDIQWHGMLALSRAGYDIVLHVYDEDIAEVPEGFGSVAEFEAIMSTMPTWAANWPIRANGGWRGKRYRKD